MKIDTYSKKESGNLGAFLPDGSRSKYFKISEFACKDKSDKVMTCRETIELLEKVRAKFGKPVTIVSGYRTPAYNKSCGGATNSNHMYGEAVDFSIAGVDPLLIAQYLESIMKNYGGIGWYWGRFAHVDPRDKKYWWLNRRSGGANEPVNSFAGGAGSATASGVIKKTSPMMRNAKIKEVQNYLIGAGYRGKDGKPLIADGTYGTNTEWAVIQFQQDKGLGVDGIVGAKTLKAMGI